MKKIYTFISKIFQKNLEFEKTKKIVRKQYAQVESWHLCWMRFAYELQRERSLGEDKISGVSEAVLEIADIAQ